MRYLRKRLTVKNDGFCESKIPAVDRIEIVIGRYIQKMSRKGWVIHLPTSAGNSFAEYEAYVWLCKPEPAEQWLGVEGASRR